MRVPRYVPTTLHGWLVLAFSRLLAMLTRGRR
jgi:hypothetical protein